MTLEPILCSRMAILSYSRDQKCLFKHLSDEIRDNEVLFLIFALNINHCTYTI